MIKKKSLVLIYSLLFLFFSYIVKIGISTDYLEIYILISILFSGTIVLINNRVLNTEHFIECEQDDILMEPKKSYDYIDPSSIDPNRENQQECQSPINPYKGSKPYNYVSHQSSVLLGNAVESKKSNKYYRYKEYFQTTSSLY